MERKIRLVLLSWIIPVICCVAVGICSADVSEVWVARYARTGTIDKPGGFAVDSSGNVYVTGEDAGDYLTIKYDTNGNELWTVHYDGPANGDDQPVGLVVDGSGNVYVAGYSLGDNTGNDYATIKYDASGNMLWVARHNGTANSEDKAVAIVVDGNGGVYVTGQSFDATSYNYCTVKYDNMGNQLWVAHYDGGSADVAKAIAVNDNGAVYVTGSSSGDVGDFFDYLTIKYDTNGSELWTKRYNYVDSTGESGDDIPHAIALDQSGNVYITGKSYNFYDEWGFGTFTSFATIKYDTDGRQQWVSRIEGYSYRNSGDDIAVDGFGNVYVTGSTESTCYEPAYFTFKLSTHIYKYSDVL